MIDAILAFSIRQRWLVMMAVVVMAALGAWNFTRLPIDAVPDITNVQVQINSTAAGYSPLEVEQRITFPIETGMGGLPNLEYTRSLSRYGLSQVTVVFKDGTDIYFARQLVNERIQQVKDQLPTGIQTAMGPISTGLGEIYMYAVEAKPEARNAKGEPYSSTELRTFQDWIVKPQLRTVPGVIEVNSIGGYEKQFHVLPNPNAADGLQAVLPRRDDGPCRQQRQRRGGLHRTQRRAISRPHAGTGRQHRGNSRNPDRLARRRAGARAGRGRGARGARTAHRRGNA